MSSERESMVALVWQHCPSKYTGSTLVVLLKLAGLSSKEGSAWPSVEWLAKACGVERRWTQRLLTKLKADGLLSVKARKGHSNRFFLNVEEIRKLPLAVPLPEQDPKKAEKPAQPGPAQELAERLRLSFTEKLPLAQIPADWQTAWPSEFQKLLDAGLTVDRIRTIARFALGVLGHREQLAKDGPAFLVRSLTTLSEQEQTFGKAA